MKRFKSVRIRSTATLLLIAALLASWGLASHDSHAAEVCNLKVVTDGMMVRTVPDKEKGQS